MITEKRVNKMEKIVSAIEKLCDDYDLCFGMEGIEVIDRFGNVLFERRWQEDYPRDIYSNTKSFINAAIGMAIFEDKLNLEARVLDYFDGPQKGNATYWENLKLIDLITMRSGFDKAHLMYFDRRNGLGANDYVEYMMNQRLIFSPGNKFLYSSGDAILAGCMVEKAVGMSLLKYLHQNLFSPLHIEYPIWECDLNGHYCGGSGLHLKLNDMIKLGLLYINNGDFRAHKFFSAEWVRNSFEQRVKLNDKEYYGFLWRISNNSQIYRATGAFGQDTLILPNKNLIIGYQCKEGTKKNKIFNKIEQYLSL